MAAHLLGRRYSDRLDIGPGRIRHDSPAGFAGSRHAGRRGRLRLPLRCGETSGILAPEDRVEGLAALDPMGEDYGSSVTADLISLLPILRAELVSSLPNLRRRCNPNYLTARAHT